MSVFDKDPRWHPQTEQDKLLVAGSFADLKQTIATLVSRLPQAAGEKLEGITTIIERIEHNPHEFAAVRTNLKANCAEGLYSSILRLTNKALIEKYPRPEFEHGERVVMIDDGEVKSGYRVVTGGPTKLNSDEVELFLPSSDDSQKHPTFVIAKKSQVGRAAQLAS